MSHETKNFQSFITDAQKERKVVRKRKPKEQKEEKEPVEEKKEECCSVCTLVYTKQVRKKIVCPYCHQSACMSCQKQYIMSSVHTAHCMFCKVEWNDDFMKDMFTSAWLTQEYAAIELNQLWEAEKARMPQTALIVERSKLINKFLHEKYEIAEFIDNLYVMCYDLHRRFHAHQFDFERFYRHIEVWNQLPKTIELNCVKDIPSEQFQALFPDMYSQSTVKEPKRAQFVKPCPAENCKGFLSTGWKCGFCDTKVCPSCHVIKQEDQEHVCKPDDIATAQMIAKDSKNCPKCGVSIFKIDGCSQMFCTNCNTGFDWKSLQIINKGIHNPHYFEWLNKTRNETNTAAQQPQVCNQNVLEFWSFAQNYRSVMQAHMLTYVGSLIRYVLHVQHLYQQPPAPNNEDLRLKYLNNQITEQRFKQLCLSRQKQFRFHQARFYAAEMLVTAATGIISQIPSHTDSQWFHINTTTKIQDGIKKQTEDLIKYYNDCIYQIHVRFKSEASFWWFETGKPTVSMQDSNKKQYLKYIAQHKNA